MTTKISKAISTSTKYAIMKCAVMVDSKDLKPIACENFTEEEHKAYRIPVCLTCQRRNRKADITAIKFETADPELQGLARGSWYVKRLDVNNTKEYETFKKKPVGY